MTTTTTVARCTIRGCPFATLKRADDHTPWLCPEHAREYDIPLPPPDDDDEGGAA